MLVTIYGFDAGVWKQAETRAEQELLEDLFDMITIDLQRVPCVGEGINLSCGGYSVTAEVENVWTSWCQPNDPDIKEEYFGDTYNISVIKVEIIETYGKRR